MVTVGQVSGTWVSAGPGGDLAPGMSHPWSVQGFQVTDAVSVTTFGTTHDNAVRALSIQNLRTETHMPFLWLCFDVANVGTTSIPAYWFNFAIVSK